MQRAFNPGATPFFLSFFLFFFLFLFVFPEHITLTPFYDKNIFNSIMNFLS